MSEKKKIKAEKCSKQSESAENENLESSLSEQIEKAVKGLYYISETDARILPFVGEKADEVSEEAILSQTESPADSNIEKRDLTEFFQNLTKIQDWFGKKEKLNARKFSALKDLLEKNLKELKVFKIGSIELDIYAVGLDENDILTGIKTKAVET